MEEEAQKFFMSCLIALACLCYSYYIPSKLPKGKIRVFSLLPIFTLYIILPLLVTRPIPITLLAWFFTWLANYKLLLYCFDIGPLSTPNSLFMFIILASLPIKPKGKDPPNYTRSEKIITPTFKLGISLFLLFVYIYECTKSWVIFGFALYLFVDICFAICAFFISPLGLELEEPSDEPYASRSLQDFWGRRWNRMTSYMLRDTVYLPTRSICNNYMGRKWAQAIAAMAAFFISGLLHELMYFYLIRAKPTWEVTWFFVIHGLCVVLEGIVKREFGWSLNLHWAISGPLTVGFVQGLGYWLFYPPLLKHHIADRAINDLKSFCNFFIPIFR